MTARPEITDGAPRNASAIVVIGLRKSFGATPVLDGIDFTVERGTVFALLGANGSGKTTTINILTTLINADGGAGHLSPPRATRDSRVGPRSLESKGPATL
jgi:ABC-type multidrug transport system ATPase subunit